MKLFNTLTQSLEEFVPIDENAVKMYVCGITPYDTTHLGHAFTYVFFDVLQRYLTYRGYTVNYTQNVTDVDDDILKRAKETNKNWRELGDFWTKRYLEDMKQLNIQSPTNFVKATDSIRVMLDIIKVLLDKGYAYKSGENVYFSVKSFKNYGKLSGLRKEGMIQIAKERGGNPNDPNKRDPLDFVL